MGTDIERFIGTLKLLQIELLAHLRAHLRHDPRGVPSSALGFRRGPIHSQAISAQFDLLRQ
jgi:hypothetical protein